MIRRSRRPGRIPQGLWLGGVFVIGALLRVLHIGAHSLWFDEAFSWLVARQPAWAILTQRLEPILPPLYHFLLHFWIRLGEGEVVLRLFSALCGLLTIPVIYVLGRELFAPAVGLAAALLTAVLPFHVYFGQEARLYALVVLLAALMLWSFVRSWRSASAWPWLGLGLLAALNLYTHYFAIFTLALLHLFVFLDRPRNRHRWRGLALSDLVALVLVGPHLPAAWARTRQVATHFWLSLPSPLQPFKTLDYLLFGHTTPVFLVPVALFLTISIFAIVTWSAVRVRGQPRRWLLLLVGLVLAPILLALLLSWLVGPVYLDRSFSLITPAYVLLLGWGVAHRPRRWPLLVLYGGLAVVVVFSLANHYLNPDPAKLPFREVGVVVREGWEEGDVLFHLHDMSYLPLLYYVPEVESYLLDNGPDAWLPPYTWEWAGKRVSSIDEATDKGSRLWLVIVPDVVNDLQAEVLTQAGMQRETEAEWAWDLVTLRLCSVGDVGAVKSGVGCPAY